MQATWGAPWPRALASVLMLVLQLACHQTAGSYGVTCEGCKNRSDYLLLVTQQLALPLRLGIKRSGMTLEMSGTVFPYAAYTKLQERDTTVVSRLGGHIPRGCVGGCARAVDLMG